MTAAAVTFEELLADFEATTARWKQFFTEHPDAAKIPTDIAGTHNIGELVRHIYAGALRTSERILARPLSEMEKSGDLASAWELQAQASANLRGFLATATDDTYGEIVRFPTRIAGEIVATRRKLCLHAFIHAIRHWAQIATILRQHGCPPDWPQDIIASPTIK